MYRFTCLLLLVLICPTIAQEKPSATQQPLLGEWLLVKDKTTGGPLAKQLAENVARITIDSESITAGRTASYKLKASDKQIDITIDDGGPKAEQGTYLGIYELNADKLKIHIAMPGQPRPTGFDAKPTTVLIVLTKSKKG